MAPWLRCSCGWWSRTSFCGSCGQELRKGQKKGKGKGGSPASTTNNQNSSKITPQATAAQVKKQVDAQVKQTLANMGIVSTKTYAEVAAGNTTIEKGLDVDMPQAPSSSTLSSDPKWDDLTPQQLKDEHAKHIQLAEGLMNAGMAEAAREAKARAATLHQLLLKHRPAGQQLDSLGAALRKATAAKEKHETYLKELEQKQLEAKQKLVDLVEAEATASAALEELKRSMATTTSDKVGEDDSLTDISAKFVVAMLPPELPQTSRHKLQADINASIAAMQAMIAEAVRTTAIATPAPVTPSVLQEGVVPSTQIDDTEPGFGKSLPQKGSDKAMPYQKNPAQSTGASSAPVDPWDGQ